MAELSPAQEAHRDVISRYVRDMVRSSRLKFGFGERTQHWPSALSPIDGVRLFHNAVASGLCRRERSTAHRETMSFSCIEKLCSFFEKPVSFFARYGFVVDLPVSPNSCPLLILPHSHTHAGSILRRAKHLRFVKLLAAPTSFLSESHSSAAKRPRFSHSIRQTNVAPTTASASSAPNDETPCWTSFPSSISQALRSALCVASHSARAVDCFA